MKWPSTLLNAAIVQQSPSIFGRQFLVDLQYEGLQTVLLDQADLAFETTILYAEYLSSNLNQPNNQSEDQGNNMTNKH